MALSDVCFELSANLREAASDKTAQTEAVDDFAEGVENYAGEPWDYPVQVLDLLRRAIRQFRTGEIHPEVISDAATMIRELYDAPPGAINDGSFEQILRDIEEMLDANLSRPAFRLLDTLASSETSSLVTGPQSVSMDVALGTVKGLEELGDEADVEEATEETLFKAAEYLTKILLEISSGSASVTVPILRSFQISPKKLQFQFDDRFVELALKRRVCRHLSRADVH